MTHHVGVDKDSVGFSLGCIMGDARTTIQCSTSTLGINSEGLNMSEDMSNKTGSLTGSYIHQDCIHGV